MRTPLSPADRDLFDEAGYLRRNPGLVEAIAIGIVVSGWDHYDKHGRREGRLPNDVDPDFYLAAYPIVATDLGRPPLTGDAAAHFILYGRARGYLPQDQAPRPDDPGAVASRFGGGWTDRADALDLIQNRFDLGRITDKQAERLRSWVSDGYLVLDLGTAHDRVDPGALALEQVFAGVMPGALFRCPALGGDAIEWSPELTPNQAAALDIHYLSRAVRSLILAAPVARFLSEIFDSPLRITASEGILRPVGSLPHQDSALMGPQRLFAGLWFGLDDPPTGEGLYVYPGSHRLPEGGLEAEAARHTETVLTAIRRGGLVRTTLAPPHGSVAVWHPDLIYETLGVTGLAIRRAIRAWVCPRFATPLHAERVPGKLRSQDGHVFGSAIYPAREPLD